MKQTRLMFVALALTLLFGACRSSRVAERPDATTGASQQWEPRSGAATGTAKEEKTSKKKKKNRQEEVATLVGKTTAQAVAAKLNLTLQSGSKKINLGGTYRLKRNEVIQINFSYTMLITVSVGTLELTPDYLLFVDRWNKRYCRVSYAEVPTLAQAGIDYARLEQVFWGESTESPSPALTWNYGNWTPLGDGQFPGQIQFALRSDAASYQATFALSNLREDDSWESHTELGSNYAPISLDAVLKALMSVAK